MYTRLSHDERCAIVALHLRGTPQSVIARAYGIGVRYVHDLVHGRNAKVEAELQRIGAAAFAARYATPSATLLAQNATNRRYARV